MADTPRYEQPPDARSEVFWSRKVDRDDGQEAAIRSRLDEGEHLRGVFGISKISPPLDLLVVTDRRVAAAWTSEVGSKGWKREIRLDQLAEVEAYGGILVDLCLVGRDGSRQKVGSLQDPDEKPALLRVVAEAREAPRRTPFADDPEPRGSAVRRETYLSTRLPSRAKGLDTLLGAVEAYLDAGEVLYAVVPVVKIQPSLDLLVVTDRRVAAGYADSLADVGWVVTVWVADLDRIAVTGMMDNVRLTFSDGSGHKVGSLRRAEDTEPLLQAFAAARTTEPRAGGTTYEVYRPPVSGPDELR